MQAHFSKEKGLIFVSTSQIWEHRKYPRESHRLAETPTTQNTGDRYFATCVPQPDHSSACSRLRTRSVATHLPFPPFLPARRGALCTSVDRSGWRRLKPERTLPTCSVLRPHAFNMVGSDETNLPSSLGIRKHLGSAGHFGAAPRSAFKISGQAYRAWFQRSMGKRALPWICSSAVASWPRRAGRTILLRGRGVVVPHLLGRRKGLGSNPNVCIHQGCSGN